MSDCLGSCEHNPNIDPTDGKGNVYLHVSAADGKTRHDATEFAIWESPNDGRIYIDIYEGPGCMGLIQKQFVFEGINADRIRGYFSG